MASVLAAQAIADSLGISVSKATLISSIAQDGESRVQRVIGSAALLCANACSQRLTTQHINRILISERKQPLVGYDNLPFFNMLTAPCDQHELCFFRESPVQLDSVASSAVSEPSVQSFALEYLLTEGVPKDKRSLSTRRLLAKPPKIDKPTSVQPSSALSSVELTQRAPVSIVRQAYDLSQIVSDVVNSDLQLYFIRIINLLRDDSVYSKDTELFRLSTEVGIHQLLPYFLQFIFGQISLHCQDLQLMDILISMTSALVKNPALGSELYVHSFLKIAFVALVGSDLTTAVHDDDTRLRDHAAELLSLICRKYSVSYPGIESAIHNQLVLYLFKADNSLAAHYGALSGIRSLGVKSMMAVMPQLKSYYKIVSLEAKSADSRQAAAVGRIALLLRQIMDATRGEEMGERERGSVGELALLVDRTS